MKRMIQVLSLLFFTSSLTHAFTNNNFKGNYAFQLSGLSSIVRSIGAPTVATGVIIADGKGKITGHGAFRTGGITCRGNLTGSYNVDADGTGFLATNFFTQTPGCFTNVVDLSIVLFNKGKAIFAANSENDYMSGELRRQSRLQ